MTQTPTMPAERAHHADKRYIYAFGGEATRRATRACATCSAARAPAWPR